jgi:hypothetical protein
MSTPQWARNNNQGPRGSIGTGLLIGVAALVLLGLAGRIVSGVLPRSEAQLAREFDQFVDGNGDGAGALRTLRTEFPDDYAAIRRQVAADLRSGLPPKEAGKRGFLTMRQVTIRALPQAAGAPDADLVAFARISREFVEHLQATDQKKCADYGMRGFSPDMEFSSATLKRVDELVMAQLCLSKVGGQSRLARPAIGDQDFPVLGRAMLASGADEALLVKMDAPGSTPSAAEECRFTVALYRAVDQMPDKESARWTGFLLQESAKALAAQPVG